VKVILGLGNPGERYERTRHNLGFLVVDQFASLKKIPIVERKYGSLLGELQQDGEKLLLVKPLTFMNRSGDAVRALFRYRPVMVSDLTVVHDDLDLEFGRIRIRPGGGPGGHRGVLSIMETLGNEGFVRMRIGIGRPPSGWDPADFVLQPFSLQERAGLDRIVSKAVDALDMLLTDGCKAAMDKFNRATD
jgi:PTH1 family peptidyl-tRNA hydrolase